MPRREDHRERSASSENPNGARKRRVEDYLGSDDDQRRRSHRRENSDSREEPRRDRQRHRTRDYSNDEERAHRRRHRHDRSRDDSRRSPDKAGSEAERKQTDRSRSRDRSRHRHRRSRSPPAKKRRRSYSASRSPTRKSRAPLPSQDESFRGEKGPAGADAPPEKQKPNFKPTGLLAKEANTVSGTTTVLKYHEPPEARKPPPKEQWRMYIFKKKDLLDTVYLHQRSVWLAGRDQNVTDLLLEHPSISKQHAVIQFRYITTTNEYGDKSSKVKPYLIDLESANGTKLDGEKVDASRFIELVDGDVVAFGDSEREYVLMLPPPDA